MLREFYVTVTSKLKKTITADSAAQIVADQGVWELHSWGVEDLQNANRLQQRYEISFLDAYSTMGYDVARLTARSDLENRFSWSDGGVYGLLCYNRM